MPAKQSENLSQKQLKAIDAYEKQNFVGQVRALEAAQYKNPKFQVPEFFSLEKVKREIARRQERNRVKFELTEDWVIQRLIMIADASTGDIISKLRDADYDLGVLSLEERYAISEFTEEVYMEGRGEEAVPVKRVKLKVGGKMEALVALCRRLGLFNDKVTVDGSADLIERLHAARNKVIDGTKE